MKNIDEFIKTYDLDEDICQKVFNVIKAPEVEWGEHWFEHGESIKDKNPENILCSSPYDIMPENIKVDYHNLLWQIIERYVDHCGISMSLPTDLTHSRFNRFPIGAYMSEHVDHIHSIFDGKYRGIPVLTLLTLWNDDFTGGELFINDININFRKNQTIVFPSIFLYPHYITRVETGERISSVSWAF
jgi:hypothetical protein